MRKHRTEFYIASRNKSGTFLKGIKGNGDLKRGVSKLIVKSLKNASQESKDFQPLVEVPRIVVRS